MPAPPAVPGVTLGERLGRGGFGEVFAGRHEVLGVDVAVKLMDVSSLPPAEQSRVLGEAQLMARLDHPNLLRVFDAGSAGGQAYIVLELMDGGSCASLHRVSSSIAQSVAFQLVSGVQALHDARVLHRDIKPANCLRRARDQRVKLADLGLAIEVATRQMGAHEAAGTVPFMAPELFEHPPRFAATSDLYALGMTLACMMLDEPPYPRGPLDAVLPWILQGPRPSIGVLRPDLPASFTQLVERMMSPRIEDRPDSAGAALVALGTQGPPALGARPAAPPTMPAVGPWLLGDTVYGSTNWRGFAVTHVRTGAAGRLMHLQPGGPLANAGALILESAESASRLAYPRIVPVIDWGLWDGRAYVVTSARGCTIDEFIRARGAGCDELTALRFAAHLADGLAFLHAQGLVYQNVDPGAAVIGADARSAQLSWPIYCVPAGTPAERRIVVPRYAAPEALSGASRVIDPAVDRFGLGSVLFFMLTGGSTRPSAPTEEMANRIRASNSEVTAPTAVLVSDLLDPDPRRRPSAAAALARMEEILARLQPPASATATLR